MTRGDKIKMMRLASGMTQRALAKAADVAPATVWNVEADRGRPRPQTVEKIARVLNQQLGSESSAPKPKKQVRWVSMKERMPEESGRYVCYWIVPEIGGGMKGKIDTVFLDDGKWNCGKVIITHWLDGLEMPEEVEAWGLL